MTKDLEVAALDAFIAKLGPHTYLGPWLADQRDAIVRDIATDILPSPMLPSTAYRKAAQIVADAREAAKVITDVATAQASDLRAKTQKACDEQRQHVANLIVRANADAVAVLTGRRS
jgi:hypothetical protein